MPGLMEKLKNMKNDIPWLIAEIAKLPPDWHGVGSVSPKALQAIARHAERIGTIHNSVETGSGKSTLLFSHLSSNHIVFALDAGMSISQVKSSNLFNINGVTFVEGPTQITLPHYQFPKSVQIALIDGPHAYPFPDMEYYYFYQIIETDGLLLLDDIKIPSIKRMFEIISADEMFELIEIVDNNLAIFKRTEAPLIDPESDNWWLQGYNKEHFALMQSSMHRPPAGVLNAISRIAPEPLKRLIPERAKRMLRKRL